MAIAETISTEAVAKNGRDVFFALGIVVILAVLFLPIPAFLIDVGLAFSIALSVLILMVALWIAAAARLLVLPDHPPDRHHAAPVAQHRDDPHDPVARQ